ncbi:MAG TPA: serine/threonine protein kinase, partial [Polyangiaceae bacterium]
MLSAEDSVGVGRLPAGERIAGKYEILEVLGEGGMGIVYVALHTELNEHVAIKMLHPKRAGDQEVVTRFVREGRTSVKIRSEHVARVLDVGT